MQSRSMRVEAFGAPLALHCDAVPEPKGRELLVRVSHCGVCHSDLHIRDGHYDLGEGKRLELAQRGISLPVTPGHEIFGEIVAAGPEADGSSIGRRGIVFPWLGCGTCPVCQSGQENHCTRPRCLGVHRPGGYADHVLIPDARYVVPCDAVAPAAAATLACSGLTAYSALNKLKPLAVGDAIGIFGLGGVGMAGLSLAPLLGFNHVIAFDRDATKRAAALEQGAKLAIDPTAGDLAAMTRTLQESGVTLGGVIDFVGAADTFTAGTALLRRGGRYVIVGLYGGAVTLPLPTIALKPYSIIGSYVGSLPELKELVDLVARGTIRMPPARTVPLEAAEGALGDLAAGRVVGRAVLTTQ